VGRLSEYADWELDAIGPTPFKEPEYSKGFAPGTWATVKGVLGDSKLYSDISVKPQVSLCGRPSSIRNGERVMVISRPGWGNPWVSAHLGVVYVLLPRIQRLGWMWAGDLKEDEP